MKRIIADIIPYILAILGLVYAICAITELREENDRLVSNQEILIADNGHYRMLDSLSTVRVYELELTLKEYKRYRADDLKLIEQLKIKGSDLQRVISAQANTINELSTKARDTIIVNTITNQIDILKCFSHRSKWADIDGCLNLSNDSVNLSINSREALKVIETTTHKRFLGFLWKTNKVKSKQVDVISENPNTEIVDCEYIAIKL